MYNKYIDLARIEFFVTNKCSSKCKHCSVQNKKETKNHIEERIAIGVVEKLSRKFNINSVLTFGGEPLLFPNIVYAIHRKATEVQIPVRQVITNGYWSKDTKKIEEITHKLAEAGVNKILISVDAFHQEYIPLELVKKSANFLLKAGISDVKWSPCWVVSKEDDNKYNMATRLILKELEDIPIQVGSGNIVYPEGAAIENLKDYLPYKKNISKGQCGSEPYTEPLNLIKSISIEPNGDVVLCRDFRIGNAHEKDILEIMKSYDPYEKLYMKTILEEGIQGLIKIVESKGNKVNVEEFYSICHLCTYLREILE